MVIRLWSEVPESERMTENRLANCVGASDPAWLKEKVDILRHPRCKAAVFWSYKTYMPCANQPNEGEDFCPSHGGKKKTGDMPELFVKVHIEENKLILHYRSRDRWRNLKGYIEKVDNAWCLEVFALIWNRETKVYEEKGMFRLKFRTLEAAIRHWKWEVDE